MTEPLAVTGAVVKPRVWRCGPAGTCARLPEFVVETVFSGKPAPTPSPIATVSAVERTWLVGEGAAPAGAAS
eukprot:9530931-Lingulodinium_polyedra.AAC.1